MAYTTIDDPEAYFQVHLYTGTGSTNARTLDGDTDLQPDMVWVKKRSSTQEWACADAARGGDNIVYLNGNNSNDTTAGIIPSFQSDGFTVGSAGNGTGTNYTNTSSSTYVAYCWKGGTTSGITGTADITPSAYSFNTTSGFSVCVYSGVGNAGDTLKTGLSSGIDFYFLKRLDSNSSWSVLGSQSALGAGKYMYLDITDAVATNDAFDNDVVPSSAGVVTLGDNGNVNASGGTHIFMGWKSIQGFSKFGSYTGNGNADGTFVYTGFRPAMVIVKRTDSTGGWYVYDNKRAGYNGSSGYLQVDTTSAEDTNAGNFGFDILSNGFKLRGTYATVNNSGGNYVYMAWAEAPLVNSNGVPCNAR